MNDRHMLSDMNLMSASVRTYHPGTLSPSLSHYNSSEYWVKLPMPNLQVYCSDCAKWYFCHINMMGKHGTGYGPVTMIVRASGYQVRCIPWVQMGTFNKEVGFLYGLKFSQIFCGEYLQSNLHLMLQTWWIPLLWKMCQQIFMRF